MECIDCKKTIEYCQCAISHIIADREKTDVDSVQVERLVIRQRQFLKAIEPYQKIKVDMYRLAIPTITCKPGGVVEHKYNFTDEQQRTLYQLDELIENARSNILGV